MRNYEKMPQVRTDTKLRDVWDFEEKAITLQKARPGGADRVRATERETF